MELTLREGSTPSLGTLIMLSKEIDYSEISNSRVFVPEINRFLCIDYNPVTLEKDFRKEVPKVQKSPTLFFEDPFGLLLKHDARYHPSKFLLDIQSLALSKLVGERIRTRTFGVWGVANHIDNSMSINFDLSVRSARYSLPRKLRTPEIILETTRRMVLEVYKHEREHFKEVGSDIQPTVAFKTMCSRFLVEAGGIGLLITPTLLWANDINANLPLYHALPSYIPGAAFGGVGFLLLGINLKGAHDVFKYYFSGSEKKSRTAGKSSADRELDKLFILTYEDK